MFTQAHRLRYLMVSPEQLPYIVHDNIAIPHFTQPRSEILTKFKIRPKTDIILASYQKSGTTWTQNILRHLLWPGDTSLLSDKIPWINVSRPLSLSLDEIEELPDPRVIKTHDPAHWICDLLQGSDAKLIYVYRNPGDVAVSYYNHMSLKLMKGVSFQDFYRDVFLNPARATHGLWEDHVTGYLQLHKESEEQKESGEKKEKKEIEEKRKDEEGKESKEEKCNILLVRYEDMIEDLPREISRIARFVGADTSEDNVSRVEEKTQFAYMKKDKTCNYSHHYHHDLFLRSGKVGSWRKFLTEEQGKDMLETERRVYEKFGISVKNGI